MTDSTDQIQMRELVFFNSSGSSLQPRVVNLDLIEQGSTLSECRLTFQVTSDLYQQIDTESFFNLKQELRGSLNVLEFHSEADIEIEATLQPQLLSQLTEYVTDSESAIAYLISCSQKNFVPKHAKKRSKSDVPDQNINPLLLTESWFALKVKQNLESGEIGYRTFWSYLNPVNLTPEAISNGQFSDAMEQFLKDRNEANFAKAEQVLSEVLEKISKDLKNWDETELLKQTETAIADFFSEVTHVFENWVEPNQPISKTKAHSKGEIYQAMLNFFSEEDWEFTKLQGKPVLRLAFKGNHGEWNCFALANEEYQRFLFYSICPLEIPSTNINAIAEFLTRANSGMEIGNFELDFDSGEIRFKTSLDVTGAHEAGMKYSHITPALIKSLVYTNVLTIDHYLPGIQAVLEGMPPVDAIQMAEQPNLA
ncbi:YbjN domain-containing protein [Cyanobacteria bacterium FACHB-63]|nr:YbjN domain-containing protein [Cyanobacteria bacterium FACHB-63]